MVKKTFKIIAIVLACLIGLIVLTVGGYVIYLSATYYRIEDNLELDIQNNNAIQITLNTEYTISTYNIGFGAYNQNFTFFMDTGTMNDGTTFTGKESRAESKDAVLESTNGAISTMQSLNADFMFFQEVDTSSHRSYFVNQFEMLTQSFNSYANTFASNFHSGYLFYPLTKPHGTVNSGICTFSKYKIDSSTRKSFPVDTSFINKFFDLDRCFIISRLKIEGSEKELVLINLHMSAYDEGGVIRAQQLKLLNEIILEEYSRGNYVIAGGDWNHDIADSITEFPTEQKVPEWVNVITKEDIPEHFNFATTKLVPTCRSAEIPYEKGVNYTVVIDGFLVSDNIEVISSENIDTDFEFSDHNPAMIKFKLI